MVVLLRKLIILILYPETRRRKQVTVSKGDLDYIN